jgi:hypothetical protein
MRGGMIFTEKASWTFFFAGRKSENMIDFLCVSKNRCLFGNECYCLLSVERRPNQKSFSENFIR